MNVIVDDDPGVRPVLQEVAEHDTGENHGHRIRDTAQAILQSLGPKQV